MHQVRYYGAWANRARALYRSPTGAGPVVEIGAGLGALTLPLAARGAEVVAFEIDARLEAPLREALAAYPKATLLFEDVLSADLDSIVGGRPYVAVGNLPYQITAPLLGKLFLAEGCRAGVLTVQREVADRLQARPGTKAYGPLTLFCSYHVQAIERVCTLPSSDFLPSPAVISVALRMVKRERPPFERPAAEAFFRAVRAAFAHRRKTLRSSLLHSLQPSSGRQALDEALGRAGLDGQRRAEELSLEEFAALALSLEPALAGEDGR